MASSILFPLELIKPTEILARYSEWIYFALILIFFISVAGITLKKHFDRPYVKPLIVSVGLMLTVGIFRYKHTLVTIFEGWGILGTILLVFIAATIPFGLSRGFGLSKNKSFYLTYMLFYFLTWIQFPEMFYFFGEKNLGLVNLFLLILFFIAIYKVLKISKFPSALTTDLSDNRTYAPEISKEYNIQGYENKLIKNQVEKLTKIEIRTVDHILDLLEEVRSIIESHRNNIPRKERETITAILKKILKKEGIYRKSVQNISKTLKKLGGIDTYQLGKKKERLTKVSGKQRQILKAEIAAEEEKLMIEKKVFEYEEKIDQYMNSFNQVLGLAMDQINSSPYPYDSKSYLEKAIAVLKQMSKTLVETMALEERLVDIVKVEERLLKKEKKIV